MNTGNSAHLVKLLLTVGFLLIVVPTGLWVATGSEGFTRWPNAKLQAADAEVSQEQIDLLADIGFEDDARQAEPEPEIESRFAFGLVPGGFDPKHLLSVAPLGGAGVVMVGVAVVLYRRWHKAGYERESLA